MVESAVNATIAVGALIVVAESEGQDWITQLGILRGALAIADQARFNQDED